MAALLLSDFGTVEELRAAIRSGRFLIDARLAAVMQVRLAGNQLKLLRAELMAAGQVVPEELDKAVDEVTGALKNLGANWRGPSAK
jgi:hypothetical protein